MRISLTVHDENGAVEVASVECINFVAGCCRLTGCMGAALDHFEAGTPVSTVLTTTTTAEILAALNRMGTLEDLPVTVSC